MALNTISVQNICLYKGNLDKAKLLATDGRKLILGLFIYFCS